MGRQVALTCARDIQRVTGVQCDNHHPQLLKEAKCLQTRLGLLQLV